MNENTRIDRVRCGSFITKQAIVMVPFSCVVVVVVVVVVFVGYAIYLSEQHGSVCSHGRQHGRDSSFDEKV